MGRCAEVEITLGTPRSTRRTSSGITGARRRPAGRLNARGVIRVRGHSKDEERAAAHATRMNGLLNATINKGRREISSVLSDGWYYAEVHENVAPRHYPERRPHYE